MVLDTSVSGVTPWFRLLETMARANGASMPPALIYAEDGLSSEDGARLRDLARKRVIKEVRSPAQLLDETSLFLHRRLDPDLPEHQRELLQSHWRHDPVLAGKTVLVVDDDVRNIFALTAILEGYSISVVGAENGHDALQRLDGEPRIDLVLMDIMMPTMDGYEATRRIRAQERFADLPVIALTAKAMKDDREKCLASGASDYITKPVDPDYLRSLLRVWLDA
jgi:hypothetical protein